MTFSVRNVHTTRRLEAGSTIEAGGPRLFVVDDHETGTLVQVATCGFA